MNFRNNLIPGDIGYLAYLHGILYDKEYRFDNTFEAYVARGLAEFVLDFDQERERIWLAESKGKIIGSIAIVKFSEDEAQLRWYLVHPDFRGQGLGRRLINEAVQFCREKNYRRIFLWTTSELTSAALLYGKSGFIKTEEKSHVIWGGMRTEEKYELDLLKPQEFDLS